MNKMTLSQTVRRAIEGAKLRYFVNASDDVYLLLYDIKGKVATVIIRVVCEDDHCMVRAEIPVEPEQEDMDEMIRYVTMANYGLPVGSFQLNVKTGAVSFKNYINTRELSEISEEQIVHAIRLAVNTAETYAAGIGNIVIAGSDAETEIKAAEHRD